MQDKPLYTRRNESYVAYTIREFSLMDKGFFTLTINTLLESVQSSVEKQVQFVADASHELKTPVTAILGYIGLIERWGINKRDVLETSVSAIKREANAMHQLIHKLLLLAKCDNGVNILDKSVFCINDLKPIQQ